MPKHTRAYSAMNVQVTIDGRTIDGFWEGDDAIEIERGSDNATPMVGIDGSATVSLTADDSVTITLRLQPASPANEILFNKYQQNRSGRSAPFNISIRDTGNGEGGAASFCVVLNRPNVTFGENATAREWTIFANPWIETRVRYNEF